MNKAGFNLSFPTEAIEGCKDCPTDSDQRAHTYPEG